MTIRIERTFPHPAATVWDVVGNPVRVDWVPGVESCRIDGDIRHFEMEGVGELAERILLCDADQFRLEYGVVESQPPLEHHRAVIQLEDHHNGSVLIWETEVRPEQAEPIIRRNVEAALDQLGKVLAQGS